VLGVTLLVLFPRGQFARLPRGLLQQGAIFLIQGDYSNVNPDRGFLEQHRQEDTCGEIGPGERGMTLVPVMQDRLVVLTEKALPGCANRNNRRAQFSADAGVGVRDELLSLWRVPSCPRHVENRLRPGGFDRFVEESDVLVHAPGVLDRQRTLLLKHDGVVMTILDGLQGFAGIPVSAK
jgi:hypothetical protein